MKTCTSLISLGTRATSLSVFIVKCRSAAGKGEFFNNFNMEILFCKLLFPIWIYLQFESVEASQGNSQLYAVGEYH